MIIASIDSGLDLVAVALFDTGLCPVELTRDPIGFNRSAAGLLRTLRVATTPEEGTVERCRRITHQLRDELAGDAVDVAIIEIPRNANRSHQASKRGIPLNAINESLMLLNRGIGAIAAGVGDSGLVLETKAFASRKELRRIEVNAALAAVGKKEVRNLDISDAIHIGLVWVTEYLRHPDVFATNVFRGELYHTWTAAEFARREAGAKASPRRRPTPASRGGRGRP